MLRIEFDIDGVLYDMVKALNIHSLVLNEFAFSEDKFKTYDFKGVPDDIRVEIFKQFKENPAIFGDYTCFYSESLKFMCNFLVYLDEVCKKKYKIIFHTYVADAHGAKCRETVLNNFKWNVLNRLYPDRNPLTDDSGNIKIVIDRGRHKKHIKSDIIVEDNMKYLCMKEERDKIRIVPNRSYINAEEIFALKRDFEDNVWHDFIINSYFTKDFQDMLYTLIRVIRTYKYNIR